MNLLIISLIGFILFAGCVLIIKEVIQTEFNEKK